MTPQCQPPTLHLCGNCIVCQGCWSICTMHLGQNEGHAETHVSIFVIWLSLTPIFAISTLVATSTSADSSECPRQQALPHTVYAID